jgi:hypothetical protein
MPTSFHFAAGAEGFDLSLSSETIPSLATQSLKKFLSAEASPPLLPIGFGGYASMAICRHLIASPAVRADARVDKDGTISKARRTEAQSPCAIRFIISILKPDLVLRFDLNNGGLQPISKAHNHTLQRYDCGFIGAVNLSQLTASSAFRHESTRQ